MMDSYCVKIPFISEDAGYFALFEGHNGKDAAREAAEYLHAHLEREIRSKGSAVDFKRCFETAYSKMDQQLKQLAKKYGTSAATCVIRRYGLSSKYKAQLANVGNVRAILSRKFQALRMSEDHTVSNPVEASRLRESEAFLIENAAKGTTCVSRALGFHALKPWVISSPFYIEFDLMGDDEAVVLLGERAWRFFRSDQEVIDFLRGAT